MSRANGPSAARKPQFRAGDWVRWGIGDSDHLAVVIEDLGLVGVNEQRYYMLREFPLWTPVREYGLAEDDLQPTDRPEKLPEPHEQIPVSDASSRSLAT